MHRFTNPIGRRDRPSTSTAKLGAILLEFSVVIATNDLIPVNVTRAFLVQWIVANVTLETLWVPFVHFAIYINQMTRFGQWPIAFETKLDPKKQELVSI